jgi:hypothetical protein
MGQLRRHYCPETCRSREPGRCPQIYNMTNQKQASHMSQIVAVLSRARWAPYTVGESTDAIAASRYIWNIALGQALYPSIHIFEVALRNRIFSAGENHLSFARRAHIRCWLDADPPILRPREVNSVITAKRSLITDMRRRHGPSRGKSYVTVDGLIAKLSLGFWRHILEPQYGASMTAPGILWPQLLRSAFPAAPHGIQRSQIEERVEAIRRLRNRTFHHEPIWNDPNLAATHAALVEICFWLSPHLHARLVAFDTFGSVHRMTAQRYLRRRLHVLV